MTQAQIDTLLKAAADEKYREFHSKIINTKLPMAGVRTPYIQKLAKQIAAEKSDFLDGYVPGDYEQILLYSFVTAYSKLPIECKFKYLDKVLPLYDNWAHIDLTVGAFKDLGKNKEKFLKKYAYLTDAPEFQRRFMVIFLMSYCITENELDTVFAMYEKMQCDDYYVNMGLAWGLSVALIKFYERTVQFLQKRSMSELVVRKTVQKARDSYRITAERKEELKRMFIK